MDITIAVVAFNAAGHIRTCLESLLRLSPPDGALEILVVDGCSTDETRRIAGEFEPRIRLVQNPGRTIASNRNMAVREASYPFIAFTDADCTVPSGWIRTLSQGMAEMLRGNSKTAGVGGGNSPPGQGRGVFTEALGLAQNSFLGSLGSVQGRTFGKKRVVSSLAGLNVLYRKAALLEVGGYDGSLENMCEDTDINYRLIKKGYTLYYLPGAAVVHAGRSDFPALCRSMVAYGAGRARIMIKHRTVFSPAYAAALGFLPVMILGGVLGFFWPWAWVVGGYFPTMMIAGCIIARKKFLPGAGLVALILTGTHFFYAAGLWRGLLMGARGAAKNG